MRKSTTMISSSCHKSPPHNTTLLEVLRVRGFLFFLNREQITDKSPHLSIQQVMQNRGRKRPKVKSFLDPPQMPHSRISRLYFSSDSSVYSQFLHGKLGLANSRCYVCSQYLDILFRLNNERFFFAEIQTSKRKAEKLLEPCLNYLQFFQLLPSTNLLIVAQHTPHFFKTPLPYRFLPISRFERRTVMINASLE